MNDLLTQSTFFGVAVSILAYEAGVVLRKKLKWGILNPLLISIVVVIVLLLVCNIDYDSYYEGAKYLRYLLHTHTVCHDVPL